jgi:DNA-binding MarR family transcriptional regulator
MSRSPGRSRTPAVVDPLHDELRKQGAYTVLFLHAVAEHFGLTVAELVCGNLLDMFGAMPAGRLAELTGLTSGAMTGVIDRMESSGFVRRIADPKDRRRVIVEPTRHRDAEFGRIFAGLGRGLLETFAELTPAQHAIVLAFVTRTNDLMFAEAKRLRASEDRRAAGTRKVRPRRA